MSIKKQTESEIQKLCLIYLQLLENQGKLYCFRAGSGAIAIKSKNKNRYFKTGKKGCPDIVCCIGSGRRSGSRGGDGGQFVGIEIKTKIGKQSDAQHKAEEYITNTGGLYVIIRSLDELMDFLNNLGV